MDPIEPEKPEPTPTPEPVPHEPPPLEPPLPPLPSDPPSSLPTPTSSPGQEHAERMLTLALEAMQRQHLMDEELHRLIEQSQGLVFQRIEQLAEILKTAVELLTPAASELRETQQRMSAVIEDSDKATEQQAEVTAALITIHDNFAEFLKELKANRDQVTPPEDSDQQ